MKKLKLVPVTKRNISLAISIAREIFPYEIGSSGIFLPEQDYRMAIKHPELGKFFIIKKLDNAVGITGYYHNFKKPNPKEFWLGYFGILTEFRGNGLGKKSLIQTLDFAKTEEGVEVMKLFTTNRVEEKSSHHLYRCVGFRKYAHWNTKPFHTYYFQSPLR